MSEQLESMLDRLGTGTDPAEPAPAFLRAVSRRRRRRRLVQTGTVVAALVAAAGLWLAMPGARPSPAQKSIATTGPGAVQECSLIALTRANTGRDRSELDLPEGSDSGGEAPVRLGLRRDSTRLEQWLSP